MSFTWNGRQLEVVKYGDNEVLYTYNSEGIRTSKTVNGITTTYQLEGAKIVSETTGDTTIWYIYDENDMIVGFEYLDEAYYFEKNAEGDVLRIFDETGKVISEYVYDAWGNVVKTIGDEDIAKVNPFRYRGYYQDNETGFYYLQSRYYDSETGRFLNADDIYFTQLSLNNICAANIYVYCLNNPINYSDYLGQWLIQAICGVVGGAIFGTIANKICKLIGVETVARVLITTAFAGLGGILGAAFGPTLVGKTAPKLLDWVKKLEKAINGKSSFRPVLFEGETAIGFQYKKFKILLHFKHKKEPEKGMHITIQHYTGKNWRKTIEDIPIKKLGKVFVDWVKKNLK